MQGQLTYFLLILSLLVFNSCSVKNDVDGEKDKVTEIVNANFSIEGHYCKIPPNTILIQKTENNTLKVTVDFDSLFSQEIPFTKEKKNEISEFFIKYANDSLLVKVSGCSVFSEYALFSSSDTTFFHDHSGRIFQEFLQLGEIDPIEFDQIINNLARLDTLSTIKKWEQDSLNKI